MAGKSDEEVRVAVDGIVAVAVLNTTAPTSATSSLPAAWKDLGYISEDGVDEENTQDSQKLKAWQNSKTVRTIVTDGETVFKFTMLQSSKETLETYYGVAVGTDGSFVFDPSAERPKRALVLDVIDGTKVIRKYAPETQVTEVGTVSHKNGEVLGYEVTITAYRNEALKGSVKHWHSALATTGA